VQIINWEIVKHPLNWLTVFAMCLIALVLLAIIFPQQSSQPPSKGQTST
jgi:hypothetical protein